MNELVEKLLVEVDSLTISRESKQKIYNEILELMNNAQDERIEDLFKLILFEKEKLHA